MQMLLMNPRRRRKKGARSHRKARRSARPMSALQRKYFGGGKRRHRRASSRRAPIVIQANPSPRRRRHARRTARRSFRRNPIRMPSGSTLKASLGSITRMATSAAVQGAGAVAADVVMGYALKLMPDTMVAKVGSRYGTDGAVNPAYYGVKLGLATALGIGATMFLPGKMKGYAAKATEGALTVGAYEIFRLMLPANIALGYYSPARVAGSGVPSPAGRMGAYTGRRLAGYGAGSAQSFPAFIARPSDARVGEAPVR